MNKGLSPYYNVPMLGTHNDIGEQWLFAGPNQEPYVHPNGNFVTRTVVLPAGFTEPNLIDVSASRRDGEFADLYPAPNPDEKGSNFGPASVDICAPGEEISTTHHVSNGYSYSSGSSNSAAMVTGAAALAWARFPLENAAQIRNRIIQTADHIPA